MYQHSPGGGSRVPQRALPPTVCSRVTGMHKNCAEVFRHAHGLKPAYVADDGRDIRKHRSGRAEGGEDAGAGGVLCFARPDLLVAEGWWRRLMAEGWRRKTGAGKLASATHDRSRKIFLPVLVRIQHFL